MPTGCYLYLLTLLACASLVVSTQTKPHVHVTAFYYLWYGNPEHDGKYLHWDHSVLPHWNEEIRKAYKSGHRHNPPTELHSPFYPARGPYSVADAEVVTSQLLELESHGIDSVSLSWWGRAGGDTQGVNTDAAMDRFIGITESSNSNVKVSFHLEPYHGRNIDSVRDDILYLCKKHANSKAVYKDEKERMLFFVYDSYHIKASDWQRLLVPSGDLFVRDSCPGLFIGLWLNRDDGKEIVSSGFDGAYTYFASIGFSFGSTPANWSRMKTFMEQHNKLFIPSAGPGYNDTKIRPWNNHNTKPRMDGEYYKTMLHAASSASNKYVSITSYNEWGEGTQIESAKDKLAGFMDYSPHQPNYYLEITKTWVDSIAAMPETCGETEQTL